MENACLSIKYKSQFTILLLLALLIFSISGLFSQGQAYTINSLPNPKGPNSNSYVSNPDEILSAEEHSALDAILAAIEDSTTVQIAVVIVQSIGSENPKMFATALFEHWGIGRADKDNGLLILSVLDQRRTEFETGYGLEAVIPDAICYRIGMQELVPYFRTEEYFFGLRQAVLKIKESIEDPSVREEIFSRQSDKKKDEVFGISRALFMYGMVAIIVMVIMLSKLWTIWYNKEDIYDKYIEIWRVFGFWWLIIFPIPYVFIFWWARRLMSKLRKMVRYSKETGRKMVRLSEEEEDDWLEKGQIMEEEVGSVDYDVWVTDDRSEVLVLRYQKRFSKYSKCPSCGFKTWHLKKTEVLVAATYSTSGQGTRIYECKNCHHRKEEVYVIPKKSNSSRGGSGGSGGGSFGGGSSGGGGGGVSW